MINSAIEKARKIPRFKALKEKVQNLSERRPVFVVTYDPRYIGETKRSLSTRLSEHKGYISSIFPTKATGIHFNKPGHGLKDVRITILEQMKTPEEVYRKEREKYLINKFNTFYRGINRMP